jgi:hypothetical protein
VCVKLPSLDWDALGSLSSYKATKIISSEIPKKSEKEFKPLYLFPDQVVYVVMSGRRKPSPSFSSV